MEVWYEWAIVAACLMCFGVLELARRYRNQRDSARDDRDYWRRLAEQWHQKTCDLSQAMRELGAYDGADVPDKCPDCACPFKVETYGWRCERCGYSLLRRGIPCTTQKEG